MPAETLHIYFTKDDDHKETRENTFIISEEVKNKSEDWFIRLANLDSIPDTAISYDAFWTHLILNNLDTSLQFYTELDRTLEKKSPSKIITHNIGEEYKQITKDLGEEYEISVQHSKEDSFYNQLLSYIVLRFSVVVFLFDELYTIIKGVIYPIESKSENQPLFLPFPGRFESIHPIIKNSNKEYNILVTSYSLSWKLRDHDYNWENGATPLSEYASLKIIGKQLYLLIKLQFSFLFGELAISTRIKQDLKYEYGIDASRTVEYTCNQTVRKDIRIVLSKPLIEQAIQDLNPSDVVVGAMNPRDRIALLAATEAGADTHYVPHSIAYANEFVPPTKDTNHYVSGSADEKVLFERYPEEMLPEIRPFGRPYLDTLTEQVKPKSSGESSPQIILATQPYDNWIRNKFIHDTLNILDKIGYNDEVIIKIHPSEKKEYYTDIIGIADHKYSLSVKDGSMSEYISGGEIVVTINSNVGIESILLGAYCISYNPFEPFTSPSSYIDGENVPYETTKEGLSDRLKQIINRPTSTKDQKKYIHHAYSIGNSAKRISQNIEK